eukprot:11523016-Heterocapsa_arctica.AAC.1
MRTIIPASRTCPCAEKIWTKAAISSFESGTRERRPGLPEAPQGPLHARHFCQRRNHRHRVDDRRHRSLGHEDRHARVQKQVEVDEDALN